MNIILPPDSERYLRDQLASGKFTSTDDVIAEALRGMREYDQKLNELRREIAVGIAEADQGLTTEFNEATLERVMARTRQ